MNSPIGSEDIASGLLKELDQVTPLATSQLQAFCSLAVTQMKQYPTLLNDIWNSIGSLSETVKQIDARISENEIKEQDSFRGVFAEQTQVNQRLRALEQDIAEFSMWKTGQEETIKAHRAAAEHEWSALNKRVEVLDRETNKAQKESNARMDSIEEAADTSVQIRDNINKRLETLTNAFEMHNESYASRSKGLISRLEGAFLDQSVFLDSIECVLDQEATAIVLKERLENIDATLKKTEEDLEAIEARQDPFENSLSFLRKDLTVLEREVTEMEHRVVELESFKETEECNTEQHERRLSDLENDERVTKLETLYPRVSSLENLTEQQNKNSTQMHTLTEKKIGALAKQIETVHPKFWELKEDFEIVKEDVKQTKDSSMEICSALDSTQGQVHCLLEDISVLQQNFETIQDQINQSREEQTSNIQKNVSFIEEALKTVPRNHEIEGLRSELEELKKELQKEIEESKHTVKFDLLHDPSPQVDHLKTYLKQQDENQTKLKQRVQLLEQTVRSQYHTIQQAQERLDERMRTLPSDETVEELEDIPRLKQRVQQMNQSIQSLQEQLIQLKKQTIDATDRPSYSRCSSLRSSVGLNTSAMNFLKKQSNKAYRRTVFMEQANAASPKLVNSPPKSAESLMESGQNEKQNTASRTPSPILDNRGNPSPRNIAKQSVDDR
eukprot:g858.t1